MNETIEQAIDRIDAVRSRPTPRRDAERAFEVEMLVVEEAVRVASFTEPREDAPFEFLQARLGARLNVAMIGWLIRRHPRVTKGDREGPSAWTGAALGDPFPALSADELSRRGVTDSPIDDPACLGAFDGFGSSYADRVRIIAQARARFEDGWISLSDAELAELSKKSLWLIDVYQSRIDAWKAGTQ